MINFFLGYLVGQSFGRSYIKEPCYPSFKHKKNCQSEWQRVEDGASWISYETCTCLSSGIVNFNGKRWVTNYGKPPVKMIQ